MTSVKTAIYTSVKTSPTNILQRERTQKTVHANFSIPRAIPQFLAPLISPLPEFLAPLLLPLPQLLAFLKNVSKFKVLSRLESCLRSLASSSLTAAATRVSLKANLLKIKKIAQFQLRRSGELTFLKYWVRLVPSINCTCSHIHADIFQETPGIVLFVIRKHFLFTLCKL